MNRIRFGLLATAVICGSYAITSWVFGFLFDAGIAGAAAGVAVILAELIAWCERAEIRRGRDEVWERRDNQLRGRR